MTPRLKSLELHGYKTFASRALFEFPGQVTAIVGPNGSGKSNVTDSVRWVLGEQSYSLLRGRKTEDMIFAGSEQRPRAGMASATIVFANEDGWLPIDFTEVSITRRAYRDGQNEYLLNGQKVRLKEIAELLAQSGLAERTYTMIGQGLVDSALSLKPDERRRFFEEAAGIGLYRARREEALNRLDATRRNLERVQDILSELEPRLQSLEKQARRAIEYERIKADLRLLLRDWYGYHWHRVQGELAHAREVLRSQEARLEQARQRLSEVEGQMGEVRARLQQLRTQLNAWHAQSAGQHTRREKISRDLAVLDERQRALLNQQQNVESDLSRLEEEHKARQEQLFDLQDEQERLQSELQDAQKQADAARRGLEARQTERAQVERNLREARRQLVASETRLVELKAHGGELAGRREALLKTQQSLTQAMQNEQQTAQKAQARLEQVANQRQQAEEACKHAEEDVQAHRKQVSELEAERRRLQEERSRLDAERTRLRAQLDVLEQAEKSLAGLNQGARFVLQSARQGRLSGRYQALNSLLEVPAAYEVAVAAVLGESLDAVLLESGSLDAVLGLLEQGEKGRAVLFPQGEMQPAGTLTAPDDDADCLGLAADLVQCADAYRATVQLLLGQVLIVRDRAAARRLVKGLPPAARVVTLKGEVFWGNGTVVAGLDGRAGTIARPRQKHELQDALAKLDGERSGLQETLLGVENDLARRRAAEQELDKAVRQANQQRNQVTQAFQQATLESEQARQKLEWQRSQLANGETQLKRTQDEITQAQAEQEKVAARITTFNEQVRDFSRQLNGMPLEELQAQVVHWNTNAAVAGRALKDAQRRVDEYEQALVGNVQRQNGLKQRRSETLAALQTLEQEKNQQRGQENELNVEIETLQRQIDPAEKELEGMEAEYSRQQGAQATAQQAVAVAERYVTQAQLELTRGRESVESLRRRIEEDFGLVAFEYNVENPGQTPLPLEGMVEQLPSLTEIPLEIEDNIARQRAQLRRMGAINPDAHTEYLSVKERFEFLTGQVADLRKADVDLRQVIAELDELMRREFRKTFDAVAAEFRQMFTRMFGGGSARLVLTDAENPTETGIDIEARLPGRREQGLSLLSGGERSLTAVCLIFSLLKVSPTPFCVMDEVDAMLDEANVGRFRDLLLELSANTQFIVVTHNRNTVQAADVIYGVTMGRDSASQVISLRLDEVSDEMVR